MPLPFKTLAEPELVTIGGLQIKKLGCLTVAEEIAIRDLSARLQSDEMKSLTELQTDLVLKLEVATILLRSRIDRAWTIDKTKGDEWEVEIGGKIRQIEPTIEMIEALFNFGVNEQRRWKNMDEVEAEPEGKPTKKRTGAKSSGGSAAATPATNGSEPADLATAPF